MRPNGAQRFEIDCNCFLCSQLHPSVVIFLPDKAITNQTGSNFVLRPSFEAANYWAVRIALLRTATQAHSPLQTAMRRQVYASAQLCIVCFTSDDGRVFVFNACFLAAPFSPYTLSHVLFLYVVSPAIFPNETDYRC